MGFLSAGIIWGVLLVLLGLSVIAKAVFHIDIPVFRVLLGLFFIYMGVQIIWGRGFGWGGSCARVFTEGKVQDGEKTREYNIIFGEGTIDLTDVEIKDKTVELKANAIFGSSKVKLKSGTPAIVHANTAFGMTRMPNGDGAAVGSLYYKTATYREDKPHLVLEINSVFGQTDLTVEE